MQECLGCYEFKRKSAFRELVEFPVPHFENTPYCVACMKADREYDLKVERILKGVFIPYYETPVFKYVIPLNDTNK